jgi:hypothetical protein
LTNQTFNTISAVEYHRNKRADNQVSVTLVSPVIVHIRSSINGFIRAEMAPSTPVPAIERMDKSTKSEGPSATEMYE